MFSLYNFLNFLRSIFGVLTGITCFFPCFDLLIHAFPLPAENGNLTRILTSISCTFVIYFSFILSSLIKQHYKKYEYISNGCLALITRILVVMLLFILCIMALFVLPTTLIATLRYFDCIAGSMLVYCDTVRKTTNVSVLYINLFTALTYSFSFLSIVHYVYFYNNDDNNNEYY